MYCRQLNKIIVPKENGVNFALKCSLRIDSTLLLGGKDLIVGMLTLSLKSNFCTFLSGFRLGIPDFCLIAHQQTLKKQAKKQ